MAVINITPIIINTARRTRDKRGWIFLIYKSLAFSGRLFFLVKQPGGPAVIDSLAGADRI